MTTNNLIWVSKRYARNTKSTRLDMNFYFETIGGTKKLRIEGLGYNVKRHQGH
jgi:hypothetical protein